MLVSNLQNCFLLRADTLDTLGRGLLSAVNSPTFTPGLCGGALTLDGSLSQCLLAPNNALFDLSMQDFSVGIKFKLTTEGVLVAKGSNDAIAGWLFEVYEGQLGAEISDGTHHVDVFGGSSLADGNEHDGVVVFDRSGTNTAKLYLDGAEVASADISAVSGSISNERRLGVGQYGDFGGYSVTGQLAGLVVWNGHALSAAEVASLHGGGIQVIEAAGVPVFIAAG